MWHNKGIGTLKRHLSAPPGLDVFLFKAPQKSNGNPWGAIIPE